MSKKKKSQERHKSHEKSHKGHKKHRTDRPAVEIYDQSNFWKFTSIALLVLLAISVFTQGFNMGTSVDSVVNDLNTLKERETSPAIQRAIENALAELDDMGSAVDSGEGSADGAIVIEEFSDFQCPFCSRAVPTVQQIKDTYGDQVNVVYKHFPLDSIHPQARIAAEASECARDQDMFWEYHDVLFENQDALDEGSLKTYAAELGLDTGAFNTCIDSGEKSDIVEQDFQEGRQKGVTGTPTFFVNGQKLVGAQPFEAFEEVIDAQISGEAPTQPTPTPTPEPEPQEFETSLDDDPMMGDESAQVAVVEWSDFQCPFCTRFHDQTLPSIIENYVDTGDVVFVYKDFPLDSIHPQARSAAIAAECADEQDMFWEYHDLLFSQDAQSFSEENYITWAQQLELDVDAFTVCLDDEGMADEVAADLAQGSAAGVRGTPGFVVGVIQEDGTVVGESIRGAQPYTSFEAAIERQLAKV